MQVYVYVRVFCPFQFIFVHVIITALQLKIQIVLPKPYLASLSIGFIRLCRTNKRAPGLFIYNDSWNPAWATCVIPRVLTSARPFEIFLGRATDLRHSCSRFSRALRQSEDPVYGHDSERDISVAMANESCTTSASHIALSRGRCVCASETTCQNCFGERALVTL